MEKDQTDSASHKDDSASLMKEAVNSTSWMNNSASPMKIVMKLGELMNNSASQMNFPKDMPTYAPVEFRLGNPTSGFRVQSKNEGNSTSHSMTRRVHQKPRKLGE